MQAADVACRQLGYDFGSGNWCGASGSPVAAKSVKCVGTELSLDECNSEAVDDACLSHARDAIIFCGLKSAEPFLDGELHLIGAAGAPSLAREAGCLEIFLVTSKTWAPVCKAGFISGAAAVACKQMGYSPQVSRLAKLRVLAGACRRRWPTWPVQDRRRVWWSALCRLGTLCSVRQKSLCC